MIIKRFHPGEYLKDELDARNMTISEFSTKTDISKDTIVGLLNKEIRISNDIAKALSDFLGSSMEFWINLQKEYDLYLKLK